jgi:hypothetical protein
VTETKTFAIVVTCRVKPSMSFGEVLALRETIAKTPGVVAVTCEGPFA